MLKFFIGFIFLRMTSKKTVMNPGDPTLLLLHTNKKTTQMSGLCVIQSPFTIVSSVQAFLSLRLVLPVQSTFRLPNPVQTYNCGWLCPLPGEQVYQLYYIH